MNKIFTFLLLFFVILNPAYSQLDSEKLIAKTKSGIVYIETETSEGISLGTGFLIGSKGYVLTSYHVVEGCEYKDCFLEFSNGDKYDFKITGKDHEMDLALLVIKGFDGKNRQVLPILGTDNAKSGIDVATIGHPKGSKFTITKGIISRESLVEEDLPYLLMTDLAVNPGNSGGPLFNRNGQVIGVIRARLERQGLFDRDIQNMNIAVNAKAIRSFLEERGIAIQTEQLIKESELNTKARELSEEEVQAQKQAELQRIELEKQKEEQRIGLEKQKEKERIELEKEQIRRQIIESIEIDKLNADQQKELSKIDFEYQKRILEQQRKLDLQRTEEKQRRELLQLLADEQELERKKQELIERRRNHFANLPCRIGLRIGGGALYYVGALNNIMAQHSLARISWVATYGITYRFDINRKDRASSFGFFGRFGNHNQMTVNLLSDQQELSLQSNQPINLFAEIEAVFLIKEWLRLSGGLGWQRINDPIYKNDYMYGVATLGFIARFGRYVELDFNIISEFALQYKQFALRGDICLVFRFAVGKF